MCLVLRSTKKITPSTTGEFSLCYSLCTFPRLHGCLIIELLEISYSKCTLNARDIGGWSHITECAFWTQALFILAQGQDLELARIP